MAMQLAINVQIPAVFGGLGGEAIYIDTEGSFFAPRAQDMAAALVSRLNRSVTGGCSTHQSEALGAFATKFAMPVGLAFRRQDNLNNLHPCYVGHVGIGPDP